MQHVQTVLLTPTFLRQAESCGLDGASVEAIVVAIAGDPLSGDLMPGTGGARKMRHAAGHKGKSGGVRTIHYFGGKDVPVFLLAVFGKSEKANLTKAERNALAALLPQIAEAYRKRKTT